VTAPTEPAPDRARLDLTRLHGAMRRLLTFFRPGLLRVRRGAWRTPTGHAWQPAVALEAVLTAYECTRDPAYGHVIAATFARYRGRRSHYCDDDGWYLNAWLRAYDLTGHRPCLDEAESLFAAIAVFWDEQCGGGVWWRRDRRYKNAVTNELFLLAAAGLHRRTGEAGYLDWAHRAWGWFDGSGMINADGLVNDGLGDDCRNNGGPTWTYNQGVILGGLVELWRATGDAGLLDRARGVADAVTDRLVHAGGVLREPSEPVVDNRDADAFKGIFALGLGRLAAVDAVDLDPAPYRGFLVANADALATRAGDGRHGYGPSWAGPSGPVNAATQASACLLLGEAARLSVGVASTG
jgi:predicted alpha-1,6-mannanase (GH76 family)